MGCRNNLGDILGSLEGQMPHLDDYFVLQADAGATSMPSSGVLGPACGHPGIDAKSVLWTTNSHF